MTGTGVAALPTSSDPSHWNDEEKALVTAAGLVHTDNSGEQTAAPRPVVAAFLQHCVRTGLDPFARQIYCIARKNRGNLTWTTQISIDGARLVAERTGTYEGQTTPEFTADGVTWTEVWLASEPPKAARVGVYRRGFREPLYAIALWEAYAVYQDEWANGSKTGNQKLSAMWAKMGPLMLAKCAEMLALRKAFPQDLSGLYTTEEMAQADPAPAAPSEPVTAPQPIIAAPASTRDWAAEIEAVADIDGLRDVYREAQRLGAMAVQIGEGAESLSVEAAMWARQKELAKAEQIVDVEPEPPQERDWEAEARVMKSADDVEALWREASALEAPPAVLDGLLAIASQKPVKTRPREEPTGGWPTPATEEDADAAEAAEAEEVGRAAVLDGESSEEPF